MARGSGIGADDGLLIAGPMNLAVDREHRDGNFQHNGVHVEAGHCIGSVVVGVIGVLRCRQHTANSHAKVGGLEAAAQSIKEGTTNVPGKTASAMAKSANTWLNRDWET